MNDNIHSSGNAEPNGHDPAGQDRWARSTHSAYWKNMNTHRHVMQVYDNEQVLLVALNSFARTAVSLGEPLLVVATPERLTALARSLNLFGVDTDRLRMTRHLVFADAAETLGRFMRNDMPDEQLFLQTLDELVTASSSSGKTPVKIFGEMVVLLWENGLREATYALEEMWTRACELRNLHLFCGYPRSLFAGGDLQALTHLCCRHHNVLNGNAPSYAEIKYRE